MKHIVVKNYQCYVANDVAVSRGCLLSIILVTSASAATVAKSSHVPRCVRT